MALSERRVLPDCLGGFTLILPTNDGHAVKQWDGILLTLPGTAGFLSPRVTNSVHPDLLEATQRVDHWLSVKARFLRFGGALRQTCQRQVDIVRIVAERPLGTGIDNLPVAHDIQADRPG